MTLPLLVLDWETYFHSKAKYSLKGGHHTTESYVRSELFNAHMLGYWAPDTMPAPAECNGEMPHDNADLRNRIETSACLFHHAQFDALILSHWYDLRPGFIYDTLAMARLVLPRLKSHSLGALAQYFGLPEKNVPYNLFDGIRDLPPDIYRQVADGCRHDVWLTKQIFDRLLPYVPEEELQVIDITARMFSEPVLELDRPRMETFLKAEKIRKAKAMIAAGEVILGSTPYPTVEGVREYLEKVETELQSSAKFKIALEALGYECPMKYSEKATGACEACNGTTGAIVLAGTDNEHFEQCVPCSGSGKTKGGWIPAIAKSDEPMKELLEHDDSRVQALAAARLGVKSTIDETRAARLLDSGGRGALPVYLSYAAAKTLRFGGGDKTNWQNFRRGGEIRKSIQAPPGHKLVIGDLSQIEYRLLCWLTGHTDKLEALKAGRDLYVEFATQLYDEVVTVDDKPRRGVGKVGILQSGYGAGEVSIQRAAANAQIPVKLSIEQALKAKHIYRAGHDRVVGFWDWCGKVALPALYHGQVADWYGGADAGPYAPFADAVPTLHIEDHKIWLPNDTAIEYEGLRWARNCEVYPTQADDGEGPAWWEPSRKGYTRTWGSHVTADVTQALAAVVIKHIMVRMKHRGWRAALQVHDELLFCVPDADVEACWAELNTEMTTPPPWCADIPLACEIIHSQEYSK